MSTPNAINVTLGIQYANGALADQVKSQTYSVTQQNQEEDAAVVTVPTAVTPIAFPDLTTNGIIFMYNLDPSNYVTWGPQASGSLAPCGRLAPGDVPAVLRLTPGMVLLMQASTAPCKVQFKHFGN